MEGLFCNPYSLVIAVVGEPYKWKLVAYKCFRDGECLLLPSILLNVIEVTCVSVTAQLWDNWGSGYTQLQIYIYVYGLIINYI